MGVDSKARKRATNERVPIAEVKNFLCYFCGDMFSKQIEYQRHIAYLHQNCALAYQIWHASQAEKNRKKSKSLDGRRSLDRQSTPTETDNERSENSSRHSSEGPSRKIENEEAKISKKRKAVDEVPKKAVDAGISKKKERNSVTKEKDTVKQIDIQESDEKNKVSEEARTQCSEFMNSERKCDECTVSFFKFDEYIEHFIEKHGYLIKNVIMFLFCDGTPICRKQCKAGRNCVKCDVNLDSDSKYYIHLIAEHATEVVLNVMRKNDRTNVNNFDMDVILSDADNKTMTVSCNTVIDLSKYDL